MKSIKQKLMLSVGILLALLCVMLGAISFISASSILRSSTESELTLVATQTATAVRDVMDGDLKELESIANSELLQSDASVAEKVDHLAKEVQRIGCLRMAYIDTNGDSVSTNGNEQNLADREYFTAAMSGNTYISDPTIGKSSGELLVFFAVPIYSESGEIIGVLQEVQDGTGLSTITNDIDIGSTGYAYIFNKDGKIIAHPESNLVMEEYNIVELAKTDENYVSWAAAFEEAYANKNGFTTYFRDGIEKFVGYANIDGTEWELMVCVNQKEILSGLVTLRIVTIVTSVIALVVGMIVIYFISNIIVRGIRASSSTLDVLASGDLTASTEEKYLIQQDEVGDMSRAMKDMATSISEAIRRIKDDSAGIDEEAENLSVTSGEINEVSQNVAKAITEIAHGTVTQSENLEHIMVILKDFGVMMENVVDQIRDVDETSNSINEKAVVSKTEMAEIKGSVEKVGGLFKTFQEKIDALGTSISEINQFTSVINEISSQTNLLALNASIEAARAGEAGRGFAVVAEEIGHLADQSQESSEKISQLVVSISRETNKIISDSATMDYEMEQQGEIIRNTIDSFQDIIVAIDTVLPKIQTVENTVKELDELKDTIINRSEEVASVATEVSASSEEISAAAEELSASIQQMADIATTLKDNSGDMQESVGQFTIE